jgi:hypothetical protein
MMPDSTTKLSVPLARRKGVDSDKTGADQKRNVPIMAVINRGMENSSVFVKVHDWSDDDDDEDEGRILLRFLLLWGDLAIATTVWPRG